VTPTACPAVATLATLRTGARAVVLRIQGEEEFAHRLMELGLVPGTEIAVIRHAPLGDPVELRVRGAHFSIRLSEAERIHVDAL
jgi:ferrous iron transport protein A